MSNVINFKAKAPKPSEPTQIGGTGFIQPLLPNTDLIAAFCMRATEVLQESPGELDLTYAVYLAAESKQITLEARIGQGSSEVIGDPSLPVFLGIVQTPIERSGWFSGAKNTNCLNQVKSMTANYRRQHKLSEVCDHQLPEIAICYFLMSGFEIAEFSVPTIVRPQLLVVMQHKQADIELRITAMQKTVLPKP